jgi:hypothetical protein
MFLFLSMLGLVALVAIVGGFLHYRRERLLTHAERMKALELGRDLPEDVATARIKAVLSSSDEDDEAPEKEKSIAVQVYTTTGWVSGCGLLFATWASENRGGPGVAYAIAASAGAIGITGMICGTILASRAPAPVPEPLPPLNKPRLDPDGI